MKINIQSNGAQHNIEFKEASSELEVVRVMMDVAHQMLGRIMLKAQQNQEQKPRILVPIPGGNRHA